MNKGESDLNKSCRLAEIRLLRYLRMKRFYLIFVFVITWCWSASLSTATCQVKDAVHLVPSNAIAFLQSRSLGQSLARLASLVDVREVDVREGLPDFGEGDPSAKIRPQWVAIPNPSARGCNTVRHVLCICFWPGLLAVAEPIADAHRILGS